MSISAVAFGGPSLRRSSAHRGVRAEESVDPAAAAAAVADLLVALGRDPFTPHLARTPHRVAQALIELLTPVEFTMTTFPNEAQYDDVVVVSGIPFSSVCEHHLLPFRGTARIGYLPGNRLVGLSKLPRTLEHFARDLQVQERLTQQVADCLEANLMPRGVGVVLEAEHLCMSLRGVQSAGAMTTTTALRGELRDDPRLRDEFLGK
jgi:GTP cyclohydrolase IA